MLQVATLPNTASCKHHVIHFKKKDNTARQGESVRTRLLYECHKNMNDMCNTELIIMVVSFSFSFHVS